MKSAFEKWYGRVSFKSLLGTYPMRVVKHKINLKKAFEAGRRYERKKHEANI